MEGVCDKLLGIGDSLKDTRLVEVLKIVIFSVADNRENDTNEINARVRRDKKTGLDKMRLDKMQRLQDAETRQDAVARQYEARQDAETRQDEEARQDEARQDAESTRIRAQTRP